MRSPTAVLLLTALALAAPRAARATDGQVWGEVGGSLELTDGLRLGAAGEVRLVDDASRVGLVRPSLYLDWRAARWISFKGGYRLALRYKDNKRGEYVDEWNELFGDATGRAKLGDLKLKLRLRLVESWGWPEKEDRQLTREHVFRQKLVADYGLPSGFSVQGSAELFEQYATQDAADAGPEKWRAGGGVGWERKGHSFLIEVLREHDLTGDGEDANILSFSYGFDP
ncbi:MAG: DUF2490 domain-containing protein [Anaeromyxobacter sp.]